MHKYVLIFAACAAACGKSSAKSSGGAAASASASGAAPASAPVAGGPQDKCEIHISGSAKLDVVTSISSSAGPAERSKVSAGTDYWLTDAELRMALETMAGVMSKKSDAEIAAEVDANMKRDPRLMLLLINCGTDAAHVNFGPIGGSRYADVPFGAKKYAVVGKNAKPGDFGVMFGFTPAGGEHHSYSISEPGTIDLTKFDKTGVAGSFHFIAADLHGEHPVTVDGTFDYLCRGSTCTK